jgi:hypothetical protein
VNWFRDIVKALGWAVAAIALAVAAVFAGLTHGLTPPVATLGFAPLAAYGFHRSPRIAWLTLAWVLLFVGAIVAWVWWAFKDFHFRAIQG